MRLVALGLIAVLAGCASEAPPPERSREPEPARERAAPESPEPKHDPPPTAAAGGNAGDPGPGADQPFLGLPEVVAEVNGHKITREEFLKNAVEWYGREVIEEMVLRYVFQQAAAGAGASITAKELDDRATNEVKVREQEAVKKYGMALKDYLAKFGQTVDQFKDSIKANEDFQRQIMLEYLVTYAKLTEPNVEVAEICVGSEQQALAVAKKAREGADFAQLAKTESTDYLAGSGGKMPEFFHGMNPLGSDFEDAAFALGAPGDVSNPVRVGDKFYVIRLIARTPANRQTFEALRQQIENHKIDKNSLNAYMRLLRAKYAKDLKYAVPDLEPKAQK